MNTNWVEFNFYGRVNTLCQDIDSLSVQWEPQLSDEARASLGIKASRLFLQALKLFKQEKKFESSPACFIDVPAERCHKFQQLSDKIRSLQEKILRTFRESDQKIPSYGTLRKIDERIQSLREQTFMQRRLPLHYGNYLTTYEKNMHDKLELKAMNSKSLKAVERETFHILANRLEDFKDVEKKTLEGRVPSEALMTHINLIKRMIGNNSQKHSVLNAFEGALTLAMKLDFAGANHTNEQELSNYFAQISSIESVLFGVEKNKITIQNSMWIDQDSLIPQKMTESQGEKIQESLFHFNVGNSSLPRELFIHDISWDVIEVVQSLKNEEFAFIPLGIKKHFVIAKIECRIKDGQVNYTYSLFNTGCGCQEHHKTQSFNQQLHVKPLKIIGIQPCGLSYTFWKEVLTCKLEQHDINFLYTLQQRHLIDIGGGRKAKSSADSFYPVQKFGTCTFSASEMALFSHLDIKSQMKMELVKASYALKKQLKVVKYRRCLTLECKDRAIRLKLLNKLRQSQILLQQSRKHLKESLGESNDMNRKRRNSLRGCLKSIVAYSLRESSPG